MHGSLTAILLGFATAIAALPTSPRLRLGHIDSMGNFHADINEHELKVDGYLDDTEAVASSTKQERVRLAQGTFEIFAQLLSVCHTCRVRRVS